MSRTARRRIVTDPVESAKQAGLTYVTEGRPGLARRHAVNAYRRECVGEEFTAKDFRTWAGTVLAALALAQVPSFASTREARRNITRAVESVAARLGNTPAISRRCYVHPAVIEAYLDGVTLEAARRASPKNGAGLDRTEAMVLGFLQQRLARAAPERAAA